MWSQCRPLKISQSSGEMGTEANNCHVNRVRCAVGIRTPCRSGKVRGSSLEEEAVELGSKNMWE